MLGKIISIMGDIVRIQLETNVYNMESIMGKNVIFESTDLKIVGEIQQGDYTYLDINLIGEIVNNKFISDVPLYLIYEYCEYFLNFFLKFQILLYFLCFTNSSVL